MADKRGLPALMFAVALIAVPLLAIPGWLMAPAAGAPAPSAGFWTDSFEAPGEWDGISVREGAIIEKGSVVPDWAIDLGTGADGNLDISKTFYVDSVRTAIVGNVQAGSQDYLPVNSSTGFAEGDEVLIVQMAGSSAGTWEFGRVAGTAVSRITLKTTVSYSYLVTSSNRAQVLRVPNYGRVTVLPGGLMSCAPWDGSTGGIVCFRAAGEVGVGSSGGIDASGRGYGGGGSTGGGSGGAGGAGGAGGGQSAGGEPGGLVAGGGAGGNGGSGGGGRPGGKGGQGGGAGADGAKGPAGKPGSTSSGSGAGSGQGGSNRASADLLNLQMGSGGGGGQGGNGGAGSGGGGGGGGANNAGAGGSAGGTGGTGGNGAAGGIGGGVIMITARDIRVEGFIRSNGNAAQSGVQGTAGNGGGAGGNGDNGGGAFPYYFDGGGGGGGNGAQGGQGGQGGGGGAGGSIWLSAFNLSLGQGLVTAIGGAGGNGGAGGPGGTGGAGGLRGGNSAQPGAPGVSGPAGVAGNTGGAGGIGRIRLDSSFSTGAVSPAGYVMPLPRRAFATVTSVAVTPASLAGWMAFSVDYATEGKSGITFQLQDAVDGARLGEWQSTGEGRESFDIAGITNLSLRLRAELYASGAETPALGDWSLLWSPNRAPDAPAGLSVDGQPAGSPGSLNLTSRAPVFEWRFSDNDTGQVQGAVNLSVWSGPGSTGTLMWRLQKDAPDLTATYGIGPPGQPLQPGTDYFVTVRTRDSPLSGPLWGPAAEARFHINAPPSAPGLSYPANGSASVRRPVELDWNASSDPESVPVTYEWEVSSDPGFAALRAGGTTNATSATVDLAPNARYYWRVRALDGFEPSGWSPVWSFSASSNRPPSVATPPRMSLFFGETRELDLTPFGSDPEEGQNLTWQAALAGGPGYNGDPPPLAVSVDNRTLRLTAGTVEGTFNVTLRAFDSENSSGNGMLFVTVSYAPPNQRPRLEFNGSAIRGGTTLRIDLLKIVRDEEPSTLRWEAVSNNTLLTPSIEGNVLVLKAGKPGSDSLVQVNLRVFDRYNLSDESSAVFTVKKPGGASGEGFPWLLAIAAVVALIAVLAILMFVLTRRRAPVMPPEEEIGTPAAPVDRPFTVHPPSPAHMPPPAALEALPEAMPEDEVIQMDDEGPAEPVPMAQPAFRPARPGPAIAPPPAAWMPSRPPATSAAPRPGPAPGAAYAQPSRYPPPARAVRPPAPPPVPAAEPAADDLPLLEEMAPVRPESRVQAPRPTKAAGDLDEIMALLNKNR